MLSSRVPVGLVRVTFLVRVAFCVALCAALSPIIAEGASPADTTSPQDEEEPVIRATPFDGSFPLFTPQASTPVVIDTADAEVVTIAAQSFSEDVKRLSGTAPDVRSTLPEQADEVILAGSVEQSGLVRQLLQQNAFDASHVDSGQWESFVFTVVEEPIEGIDRALVVAGSDPRGTAFGLFELSKRMGVSRIIGSSSSCGVVSAGGAPSAMMGESAAQRTTQKATRTKPAGTREEIMMSIVERGGEEFCGDGSSRSLGATQRQPVATHRRCVGPDGDGAIRSMPSSHARDHRYPVK